MSTHHVPVSISDPINARILMVSEDRVQGFQREPLAFIARESGVETAVVRERIRAMLQAGTIRRVRQTLLATQLAPGALVAWELPEEKLEETFDFMFREDPFSGHVVLRSTDTHAAGAQYKLWSTLKVPQGYSLPKHADYLKSRCGARSYCLLPARKVFTLGVGHLRRRSLEPGARAEVAAEPTDVSVVALTDQEWRVLLALKRELTAEELAADFWTLRAEEAAVPLETFCQVAEDLDRRKIIGRFSTFLEHVKPLEDGARVTRFNGLFHWAVPPGQEIAAGREVGRHHIMTHAYWRPAGAEFRHVNIMGVVHGMEKATVLAHKAAIDQHLLEAGITLLYTNVFWGGRSEIKPSEISPFAYADWCRNVGLDPALQRE